MPIIMTTAKKKQVGFSVRYLLLIDVLYLDYCWGCAMILGDCTRGTQLGWRCVSRTNNFTCSLTNTYLTFPLKFGKS
jgi:hypothetical protein